MDLNLKLKEELLKGDYKSETEDEYVKNLKTGSRKNTMLVIGMGALYIIILIISLIIV